MRPRRYSRADVFSHPHSHSTILHSLRLVWILLILWLELGFWHWNLRECKWPDGLWMEQNVGMRTRGPQATDVLPTPSHLLLLSDLNILDSSSPLSVPRWLRPAARAVATHAMSQSFSFLCKQLRPDGIVFLGNIISGGHLARETELEYLVDIFFDTFRVPESSKSVPIWHLAGNHDIGLGYPAPYSRRARERFMEALDDESSVTISTRQVEFGNHTLFLLDAPGFVDEDHIRIKSRKIFRSHASLESFRRPNVPGNRNMPDDANVWVPQQNGAMDYVQKTTRKRMDDIHSPPLILFSHIPLARPDNAGCSSSSLSPGQSHSLPGIKKGVGLGYQNTLSDAGSEWILGNLKPEIIFSANHLEHCEFVHSYLADIDVPSSPSMHLAVNRAANASFEVPTSHERNIIRKAKEVTVTTFAPFFMGVQRSGFQLLSLWNPVQDSTVAHRHSTVDHRIAPVRELPTFSERSCLLPDLSTVYFYVYPTSILLTLLLLTTVNLRVLHIRKGDLPRLPNPIRHFERWSHTPASLGVYRSAKVVSPKIYEVVDDEEEGMLHDSQATIRPLTPPTPKPPLSRSNMTHEPSSLHFQAPSSRTSSPLASWLPNPILPVTLHDSEDDEEKGLGNVIKHRHGSMSNGRQVETGNVSSISRGSNLSKWRQTVIAIGRMAWRLISVRGDTQREKEKRAEREQREPQPGWKYVPDDRFGLTLRLRTVSVGRMLQLLKRGAKAFVLGRAGNGSFASRLTRDCAMVVVPTFLFFVFLEAWLVG